MKNCVGLLIRIILVLSLTYSIIPAIMVDRLRSKSAVDKSSNDKVDESALRMQQMQEKFQKILLEMHLSLQERQEHADLATQLAAIE